MCVVILDPKVLGGIVARPYCRMQYRAVLVGGKAVPCRG